MNNPLTLPILLFGIGSILLGLGSAYAVKEDTVIIGITSILIGAVMYGYGVGILNKRLKTV